MSPRVVFEPIGEEIDCDEEESVLDAAFRHGYNLVYGCREGQCSACKAYLLEGEVVLKPYSTFALSESEESNGYTLLCRAMPEEDLVVELLHFDPDNYRLENAIRDGRGDGDGGRVADARHPPPRAARSPSRPTSRSSPASTSTSGSPTRTRGARSRWPTCPATGRIELIIKRYPDGRFSSMLDGAIDVGRRAAVHRPLRRLPPARDRPADPDGRRRLGHGADPFAAAQASQRGQRAPGALLLRRAHRAGPLLPRPDRGARRRACPTSSSCPCCRTTRPASSTRPRRYLESGEMSDPEVYMCGPPPMIDAMIELATEKPRRRRRTRSSTTSSRPPPMRRQYGERDGA